MFVSLARGRPTSKVLPIAVLLRLEQMIDYSAGSFLKIGLKVQLVEFQKRYWVAFLVKSMMASVPFHQEQ